MVRPLCFSFPKKMASRQVTPPPKEHCFLFTVPDSTTSVDEIIDSVEEVTGANGVLFLQHLGGFKFLVCVKTPEQATQLLVQGSFKINENEIPIEAVGTPCVPVNIFRLPPYISHEAVTAALQPFGKVRDVTFAAMHSRQGVFSGTRVAKLEMTKPAPNFLNIQGHRAMLEYRGMRRVCGKCNEEGHVAANCTTPHCDRCKSYGHSISECTGKCRRCGREHSTKDCFLPRSYAAAIRSSDGKDPQPAASTLQARSPTRQMTTLTKPTTPSRSATLKATLLNDLEEMGTIKTTTNRTSTSQTPTATTSASQSAASSGESDDARKIPSDAVTTPPKQPQKLENEDNSRTGKVDDTQKKQEETEGNSRKPIATSSSENTDNRPLRPMMNITTRLGSKKNNQKNAQETTTTRNTKPNEEGNSCKNTAKGHQSRRSSSNDTSTDSTDPLRELWIPEAATTSLPELRRDRSRSQRRPQPESTSSGGDASSAKASSTKKPRVESPANSHYSSADDVSDNDMF